MQRQDISVKITDKTTGKVEYYNGTKRVLDELDVAWDDDGESIIINTGDKHFEPDEIQKLVNYAEDLKVRAAIRSKHNPNKKVPHEIKQQAVMANAEKLGVTLADFQQAIVSWTAREWVRRHYARLQEIEDQTETEDD